jgi:hypothetical protein
MYKFLTVAMVTMLETVTDAFLSEKIQKKLGFRRTFPEKSGQKITTQLTL